MLGLFIFAFRRFFMKGYWTGTAYMGLVGGRYMQFVSEEEYIDYMKGE